MCLKLWAENWIYEWVWASVSVCVKHKISTGTANVNCDTSLLHFNCCYLSLDVKIHTVMNINRDNNKNERNWKSRTDYLVVDVLHTYKSLNQFQMTAQHTLASTHLHDIRDYGFFFKFYSTPFSVWFRAFPSFFPLVYFVPMPYKFWNKSFFFRMYCTIPSNSETCKVDGPFSKIYFIGWMTNLLVIFSHFPHGPKMTN